MEQTMTGSRADFEAPALTELEQREIDLASARDAVARAYAQNRMGLGGNLEQLRARYDQLSIQYGHESLEDELLLINDETQRNAKAIGYIIEESRKLTELIDDYTESNIAYRMLRGLDEKLEKGPRSWSTAKRIGMTVVMAAAGKTLFGVLGGAIATGASVAVQDVAKKLRFESVGEYMSTQFDTVNTNAQASSTETDSEVTRAHREAMLSLEKRIIEDHTQSREIYRSAAIKGGKVGVFAGIAGVALAEILSPASAAELSTSTHAYTSEFPSIGAGTDSISVPSIHEAGASVEVPSLGDASGDINVPTALQSSGLFEAPSIDVQSDTVSVPSLDGGADSIRIDSLSAAGDGTIDVPASDSPQSIRVAEMTSGQDVSATSTQTTGGSIEIDSLNSSDVVDVAGADTATGDIEVPSIHDAGPSIEVPSLSDAGPDVQVPSIDSPADVAVGGLEPGNTAEFNGELPTVDNGEGLNSFVHDNYDMHLTHEQSLKLGEELHERGFMYRDDAYLGERYGNPFGISEPGVIDQEIHDTLLDFKDDGLINNSVDVAGADTATGDIEVPSIHDAGPSIEVPSLSDAGPDVQVPSIDSPADVAVGGLEPGNTAEFNGELPTVDNGEGLNSFVHDNYGYQLSPEQSMELGESLNETGQVYESSALAENAGQGNPFGINAPGEIDTGMHVQIQDMIDNGELDLEYNMSEGDWQQIEDMLRQEDLAVVSEKAASFMNELGPQLKDFVYPDGTHIAEIGANGSWTLVDSEQMLPQQAFDVIYKYMENNAAAAETAKQLAEVL